MKRTILVTLLFLYFSLYSTLFSSTFALPQHDRIVIAIDLLHGSVPRLITEEFESTNFLVNLIDDKFDLLDYPLLKIHDLIVIYNPQLAFDSTEIEDLSSWIYSGGRLFLICGYSTCDKSVTNKLLSKFAVMVLNEPLSSPSMNVRNLTRTIKSPFSGKVLRITIHDAIRVVNYGNFSEIRLRERTFNNEGTIALYSNYGKGKVFILLTPAIVTNDSYDNRIFLEEILNWLTSDIPSSRGGGLLNIVFKDEFGRAIPLWPVYIFSTEFHKGKLTLNFLYKTISNIDGRLTIKLNDYYSISTEPYPKLFEWSEDFIPLSVGYREHLRLYVKPSSENLTLTITLRSYPVAYIYLNGRLGDVKVEDLIIQCNNRDVLYHIISQETYSPSEGFLEHKMLVKIHDRSLIGEKVNFTIKLKDICMSKVQTLESVTTVDFHLDNTTYHAINIPKAEDGGNADIIVMLIPQRLSYIKVIKAHQGEVVKLYSKYENYTVRAIYDYNDTVLIDRVSVREDLRESVQIKWADVGFILIIDKEYVDIYPRFITLSLFSQHNVAIDYYDKGRILIGDKGLFGYTLMLLAAGKYYIKFWYSPLRKWVELRNSSQGFSVERGGVTEVIIPQEILRSYLKEALDTYKYVSSLASSLSVEGYIIPEVYESLSSINDHLMELSRAYEVGDLERGLLEYETINRIASEIKLTLELYVRASHITIPILFMLIMFSSFALSRLVWEADSFVKQTLLSATIFIVLTTILYHLHPGFTEFFPIGTVLFYYKLLFIAALYLSISFLIFVEIPSNIARVPTPEKAHFWGVMSTVFHLVINNLRRRKLRTSLTIVTMTCIILSFVSFMSIVTEKSVKPITFMNTKVRSPVIVITDENYIEEEKIKGLLQIMGEGYVGVLTREVSVSYSESMGYIVSRAREIEIGGVIVVYPKEEKMVTYLDECVVEGCFFTENDTRGVIISKYMALKLGVRVGDKVAIRDRYGYQRGEVKIVGIFDENALAKVMDASGRPLRAYTMTYDLERGTYTETPVDESYTILITKDLKYLFPLKRLAVIIIFKDYSYAKLMANKLTTYLKSVTFSYKNRAYKIARSRGFSIRGLTATVPVILGILIGTNTMMASVHEKRRDIQIYSALGFNPSLVKFLFMAEALIISLVGGAIGYVLGLLITVYGHNIGMFQGLGLSVTPLWTVSSFILSIVVMVVATIYPAERAALQVVPSYVRKWKQTTKVSGEFVQKLPFRIERELIDDFEVFLKRRIETVFPHHASFIRSSISFKREFERRIIRIEAEMVSEGLNYGIFILDLRLSSDGRFYEIYLESKPLIKGMRYKELAYSIIDEIRKSILAWQAIYKRRYGHVSPK